MNTMIFDNRIVNLDNITYVTSYAPGDSHPTHLGTRFDKYEIWFEFNASPDSGFTQSGFANKEAWDSAWSRIVASMTRAPND